MAAEIEVLPQIKEWDSPGAIDFPLADVADHTGNTPLAVVVSTRKWLTAETMVLLGAKVREVDFSAGPRLRMMRWADELLSAHHNFVSTVLCAVSVNGTHNTSSLQVLGGLAPEVCAVLSEYLGVIVGAQFVALDTAMQSWSTSAVAHPWEVFTRAHSFFPDDAFLPGSWNWEAGNMDGHGKIYDKVSGVILQALNNANEGVHERILMEEVMPALWHEHSLPTDAVDRAIGVMADAE